MTYLATNSFSQLVNFPTRDNNILDLVFTDNTSLVINVCADIPLSSSDHDSINFTVNLYANNGPSSNFASDFNVFSNYDLCKADWSSINNMLCSIDWSLAFENCDVEMCWNNFYAKILEVISALTPLKHNHNEPDKSKRPTRRREELIFRLINPKLIHFISES